ncbi:metallophosphoesterase family protein [Magnetovibrio sp. PR-2]|uniref:metallophosphoesterase family protein n=1 Tax=Magnetovibrio sp. PR-2 TaxID=3120356 RepID=UPI002FCDF3BE
MFGANPHILRIMDIETPQTSLSQSPSIPPGTRVYAVGDIHGRSDLLDQLLQTIAKDSVSAPDEVHLVFLGDYVDRGPDSKRVLERFVGLKRERPFIDFEIHILKGNHEVLMETFLNGDDGDIWFNAGGLATLVSYDVPYLPKDGPMMRESLAYALPKSHKKLLSKMENIHCVGDYAFVHAGVRPGVPIDQQDPDDLTWIRRVFLDSEEDFGKMVVHGHTPVAVPDVLPNRIAIDTKAWCSNTLTAIVLEGESQRFLST